jgi:competence protein ComEC
MPAFGAPLPASIHDLLDHAHHALAAPFTRVFPADEASLATGLVIGTDAQFSGKLRTAMRGSGTTHLVALSGYNVSIIIASALALFARVVPRRTASWFAGIGIVLFTLTAGAQPSLVRAAIMGILVLMAYEAGRLHRIQYTLLYTAAGMLLFDPMLVTNIGAQLSFVSLLGLVYIEPLLPLRDPRVSKGVMIVIEQARTTVAAQMAVLPLLLVYFGNVNLLSVVANIAILPFVPLAMLLAVMTSLTAIFIPAIAFLPATLLHFFLSYMLRIIYLFSRIMIPLQWQMTAIEAVILFVAAAAFVTYARYLTRQTSHR